MVDVQGQLANLNGKHLESLVEVTITRNLGVESEYYARTEEREDILLKNVPYKSIYGGNCRSEFVLNYQGRSIRIECKSQKSHGSVDEKLPYLFMNMNESIEEDEAIVILNGNGFRYGAKEWMYSTCKGTKIKVFSLKGFNDYVKKGMPKDKPKNIPWYKNLINKCFSRNTASGG